MIMLRLSLAFFLFTLFLTISYYKYHHGNHDPDHYPCQEAQKNDEKQAGDHSNNQATGEKKMVKEEKKISLSEDKQIKLKIARGKLRKMMSDLHQDPVPRLCVILKDFHDHLTSLNYQSGIPVGRVLHVYGMKH